MDNNNQTQHLFMEEDRGVTVEKDGQRRCMGCMKLYSVEFELCPYCGYELNSGNSYEDWIDSSVFLHNRYTIGNLIKSGGLMTTYIAWDNLNNSKVFVEEYAWNLGGNNKEKLLENIIKKRNKIKLFCDSGVVLRLLDWFNTDEKIYFVREYKESRNLVLWIENKKPSVTQSIEMAIKICQTTAKLHDIGMVHGEICLENILIDENGEVYFMDDNLHYADEDNAIITYSGFSPLECYYPKKLDVRSDIYSIGAILYWLLTGIKPDEAISRMTDDSVISPHKLDHQISKYISDNVMKEMNLYPQKRFNSVYDFQKILLIREVIKRRFGRRVYIRYY